MICPDLSMICHEMLSINEKRNGYLWLKQRMNMDIWLGLRKNIGGLFDSKPLFFRNQITGNQINRKRNKHFARFGFLNIFVVYVCLIHVSTIKSNKYAVSRCVHCKERLWSEHMAEEDLLLTIQYFWLRFNIFLFETLAIHSG